MVTQLPETTWREYVLHQPQGNIFHSPEMAQVFAQTQGYRPSLWAVVDGDNWPLALLTPVEVTVFGGLVRPLTTRAILYGGALYSSDPVGRQALALLLRTYQHEGRPQVLFTELRHLHPAADIQPILAAHNFVYEDHLNYLVDLNRAPEAIMQQIGARTRKNIRRALRDEQLVVEEALTQDQAIECYALLQKTYATARVALADSSLLAAAFKVLAPKSMAKFWRVRLGDTYIATSIELPFKSVVYGWYGGVDREYRKYSPNEVLMWRILEWGATHGYQIYDFGGAGRPAAAYGVREFKAKFGGRLVNYGRHLYVPHPLWLQLSRWGYTLYRYIRR